MTDGLKDEHREAIIAAIAANDRVERAVLFGSRATGTNTVSSDVDIALFGDRLTLTDQARLAAALDEIPMAQEIDIVLYDSIRDHALREQVRRDGVEWYADPSDGSDQVTLASATGAGVLFDPLPSDWERSTLGEVCERSGGNIQTGPFGSQLYASDYRPEGIPSIMPKNLGDNRVIEDDIARIGELDASRLRRYLVRKGDIVYSRRGDVEKRALIGPREDGWLCGTGCLRVRLGQNGVDPSYASYYLGHTAVREWIVRHAHGATMPNLNTAILAACPFLVPPRSEQIAIAHVLGTLDDKIELNRRMNATLEAMARALFKSWFVAFDPIRAKMEGRDTGLPREIADLFPDTLDVTGKPEGWHRSNLGDEISVLETGKRPHGGVASISEGIPSVGAESIISVGHFDFSKTKYVPHSFFSKMRKGHVSNGDVLIYKDGGKPGELHPAVTYVSKGFPFSEFCVNEHVFRIRTASFSQPLLYCLLSADDALWQMRESATGVAQPGLNREAVRSINFTMPRDRQLLSVAEAIIDPLIDGCNYNSLNSRTLAQARDILLTKIMSGEVRLREAGKVMEELA